MRKYHNEDDNQEFCDLAKQLANTGYLIIKNFIQDNELDYLVKNYGHQSKLTLIQSSHEYHKFYVKYFHPQSPSCDSVALKIIERAMLFRNRVMINKNFDQFLLEYCQLFEVDPLNQYELVNLQMKHTFARFALYAEGQGQMYHYDNPGEIQIIIPLSKYNVDYTGGLAIKNDMDKETCIDKLLEVGDMVLLNAYKLGHSVLPVKSITARGRQHLFIATVPWYTYPQAYYFKNNPLRPFSINPSNISNVEKIGRLAKLYARYFLGKGRPLDSGYKG